MIKVGVLGAKGRMGQQVCATVNEAPGTEVVARVDTGDALGALLAADVVVDFTHVGVVMDNLRWCVDHGVNVAVGTSGFAEERLAEVRGWLDKAGAEVRVLIAPNFSIGAVLMMRFAAQAARFFESAEVIASINAVTHDDVRAVAETVLTRSKALAVVGPFDDVASLAGALG